jgi:hypothetical protein
MHAFEFHAACLELYVLPQGLSSKFVVVATSIRSLAQVYLQDASCTSDLLRGFSSKCICARLVEQVNFDWTSKTSIR